MGFFSSIKKLWTRPEAESPESPESVESVASSTPPESPESVESSAAVTSPDSSESPESFGVASAAEIVEPDEAVADAVPAIAGEPVAAPGDDWRAGLALRLREADPRLSVWLHLALEGVDEVGSAFDDRVGFLLVSLGAPEDEAARFTAEFATWAAAMEYRYVEDFRSELQYRLALALELEDEEDERSRLVLKLQAGLARTREQLGKGLTTLFASHGALSGDFWDELEELFIMADMGAATATGLVRRLKDRARSAGASTPDDLTPLLTEELEAIFRIPRRVVAVNPPEVVLVIGVNGVGKTTTIAKLAYRARMQGKKVLLAAGDTFRAAAVTQLGVWAERTGSGFHAKGQDADPASVAWEAVDKAVREGYDTVFIDTAGRLHTKINLMEELKKIRDVIGKKHPGAPHRSILIIDATTGQNALSQTKLFKEAAGIDEIILTKLDGTAKGGVAVAVALEHKLPISYVGLGEKMEDLRPFDGEQFARALLGRE